MAPPTATPTKPDQYNLLWFKDVSLYLKPVTFTNKQTNIYLYKVASNKEKRPHITTNMNDIINIYIVQ